MPKVRLLKARGPSRIPAARAPSPHGTRTRTRTARRRRGRTLGCVVVRWELRGVRQIAAEAALDPVVGRAVSLEPYARSSVALCEVVVGAAFRFWNANRSYARTQPNIPTHTAL